jgi:hypothetical protein
MKPSKRRALKPFSGGRLPSGQQLAPEGALAEILYMKPSKEEGFELKPFSGGRLPTREQLAPEGCSGGISGMKPI